MSKEIPEHEQKAYDSARERLREIFPAEEGSTDWYVLLGLAQQIQDFEDKYLPPKFADIQPTAKAGRFIDSFKQRGRQR